MAQRIAGILAICAFAMVCLVGVVHGLEPEAVLGRALVAMLSFYLIGRAVGFVATKVLTEHFLPEVQTLETPAAGEEDSGEPAESEAEEEARV